MADLNPGSRQILARRAELAGKKNNVQGRAGSPNVSSSLRPGPESFGTRATLALQRNADRQQQKQSNAEQVVRAAATYGRRDKSKSYAKQAAGVAAKRGTEAALAATGVGAAVAKPAGAVAQKVAENPILALKLYAGYWIVLVGGSLFLLSLLFLMPLVAVIAVTAAPGDFYSGFVAGIAGGTGLPEPVIRGALSGFSLGAFF